jgi:Ammonia permease
MNNINVGDTAFMIFSTALVMLMTPGLALFYGGMVRRKNVLSTTAKSYAAIAIVSVQWLLIGYTLCFGKDIGGFIGNFQWLGLKGVGFAPNADYAATIPQQLFMLFQLMFAVRICTKCRLCSYYPTTTIYVIPAYVCSNNSSFNIRSSCRKNKLFGIFNFYSSLVNLSL